MFLSRTFGPGPSSILTDIGLHHCNSGVVCVMNKTINVSVLCPCLNNLYKEFTGTMATCLALLVSLEARSGPSLDGGRVGAGGGVGGPVGGAHPSGLCKIPNAPGRRWGLRPV